MTDSPGFRGKAISDHILGRQECDKCKTASVGKTQEIGWVVAPAPVSHEAWTTTIMSVSGLLRINLYVYNTELTSQSKPR